MQEEDIFPFVTPCFFIFLEIILNPQMQKLLFSLERAHQMSGSSKIVCSQCWQVRWGRLKLSQYCTHPCTVPCTHPCTAQLANQPRPQSYPHLTQQHRIYTILLLGLTSRFFDEGLKIIFEQKRKTKMGQWANMNLVCILKPFALII